MLRGELPRPVWIEYDRWTHQGATIISKRQDDWSLTFRRGFVAAVTCTAQDWLAHGDAITAAQPIEEVTLTTLLPWEFRPYAYRVPVPVGPQGHALRSGIEVRLTNYGTWIRFKQAADATHENVLRAYWPRVKKWHLPGA